MTITKKNLFRILLVLSALLVGHGIASIQLSREDDFSFEKHHQFQNDSIVKSIKTIYGSIYDCVDFYKQPAFNHPSLKCHNFHPEMKPREFGSEDRRATNPCHACQQNSALLASEDIGCPTGTVPIKRISKNDFIQMKGFAKYYASRFKTNKIQPQPGTRFAILQTNSDPNKVKYYGVRGIFNVYQLSIGPSQYSSGELIIQNEEESIQVGWTINPSVNKDNKKHLFQYLNAGQSHCFNTLCPGFVTTSKDVTIDSELYGESKRGGTQKIIDLRVFQDPNDGNWWVQLYGKSIGFWARQIFKKLGDGATYIAVGGEVYSPSDQPLPPMGNGYYPVEDMNLSAYCRNVSVLDGNQQWVDPQDTETYVTDNHYGIYDVGQNGWYGRMVYYGGTTLFA